MKADVVKKASEILEEIEDLKRYSDFLKDREYGKNVHFEIRQYYGEINRDALRIIISEKHNNRLFSVIDTIIKELEAELDAL